MSVDMSRVEQASADRACAWADGDRDAERVAAGRLREAVAAAMAAGACLADLAVAESTGRDRVRDEAGPEALKRLARANVKAQEAAAGRDRLAVRAARLGVPRKAIAEASGLSVSAVKALTAERDSSEQEAPAIDVEVSDKTPVAEVPTL